MLSTGPFSKGSANLEFEELAFVQIVGAFWYLLSVKREDDCWHSACKNNSTVCNVNYLYCGNEHLDGYDKWKNASGQDLLKYCSPDDKNQSFNFGIFAQSLTSGVVASRKFFSKLAYCFWWGLQNLRYLEFSRLSGVQVPLFENMDERLLDAICERLKPTLYIENTYILREGDPVDEMLFIIRGRLESITTDGGRSGFFNRIFLKERDFCGEELLTWALDPKSGGNLPTSTRTVKALKEVEAFALNADELKFVASQFRRLHSRQVQHTFRFYSQQWRTWAACFIQAAWRRYTKRKIAELRRKEEEAGLRKNLARGASSLGAAIYASRFAANALRGVHRLRNRSVMELVRLQKPPEPDFTADDAD
ncbi:hypothetical protein BHE74_00030422 [Ensete ventricosum]|uniref:Cyclic nucleotide-binding domain-containing protein n=1 Tax=Ensete ventricosum TaxID=4639 RepID=A0A426XLX5_ENSVE|nr:hypothetical protein B296_00058500 [Ensete ventricosum]RWW62442.1 hypothetical protein BHE74_00030422 [Ensete ventricosum]